MLGWGWVPSFDPDVSDADFAFYLVASMVLVVLAGLMSGLTLGLMSLDEVDLEILRRSGSSRQKSYAERISPVIQHQHRLLVTLLLINAVAAEALPLCIDRITDPITAVVLSVTVVLLFGEIVPQAACSQYGLQIGAFAAPVVQALMWITFPLNAPIAWVLDQVIGHRRTALFKRAELKALVDIHGEGGEDGGARGLTEDEVKVIKGALDLTHKRAKRAMTPLDMVFMLPSDALLDEDRLTEVLASGHSRIPVHRPGDRRNILGILLVKELILVNPSAGTLVSQMKIRSLPHMVAETPMYDMLKLFEIGRSHMAVLTQPTQEALEKRGKKIEDIAIDVYSIDDSFSDDELEYADGDEPRSGHSSNRSNTRRNHRNPSFSDFNLQDFAPNELEPIGIITIEDVLEELLGSEIVDETDQWVDNMRSTRVNAAVLMRSLPPHLKKAVASWALLPRVGGFSSTVGGNVQSAASGRFAASLTAGSEVEEYVSPTKAGADKKKELGGPYGNLPRVFMPSRPRPSSLASHMQQQQQPGASGRPSLEGGFSNATTKPRRAVNFRSSVQDQIDLLQPLLVDVDKRRYTDGAVSMGRVYESSRYNDDDKDGNDIEEAGPSSSLTRQNSI